MLDPLEQHVTSEIKAAEWRDGELVAEEVHELRIALYFTQELLLLLEQAGFEDVTMRAGYEDREPTAEDEFVVFLGRKAS